MTRAARHHRWVLIDATGHRRTLYRGGRGATLDEVRAAHPRARSIEPLEGASRSQAAGGRPEVRP